MKDITVNRKRKLNIDESRLVGSGYASWVYELEDGNVVKVLKKNGFEEAEREIRLAKWAFSKGIPTAISYDVVDVNGRPGLVYESLGRGNLRRAFINEPERFDEILEEYIDLLHTVHSVVDTEKKLPAAITAYREMLKNMPGILTNEEIEKMSSLLDTIPETDSIIHGDCQIKNVRVVDGKFFLIDLDTLSRGDPIFELASVFCCYRGYPSLSDDTTDNFFEIPKSTLEKILRGLLDGYFTGLSEIQRKENERKIAVLAWFSMIAYVRNDTDDNKSVSKMKKYFRDSLDGVNDLLLVR